MSVGDFEWSVTFDTDLRFRRFFNRWKAEIEGFQTVKESSKTDISIDNYGPFVPTTGDKQLCNGYYSIVPTTPLTRS